MNNHATVHRNVSDPLRIVVATDLQVRSEMTLRRAISLAKRIGAKLRLVHAVPKSPSRSARMRRNIAYAQVLAAFDEAINGVSKSNAQRFEHIDIDVRVGKPLDVISAAARDANADLIVIAAPQARSLDAIVGTTAERLIRATQRPVLIVHREMHDHYRSAAVATDLSDGSVSLLQTAVRLGFLDQTSTTLLHAFDLPYAGMLKSAGVQDDDIQSIYSDWRDELETKARGILDAAGVATDQSRVVVAANAPAMAIRETLEQRQTELLVLGASRWFLTKRLLLGSIADDVLRTAQCDVLVIPRKLEKAYLSGVRHTATKPIAVDMDEIQASEGPRFWANTEQFLIEVKRRDRLSP